MTSLHQEKCVPCSGQAVKLSAQEVEQLLPQVPGWQCNASGDRLLRAWRFGSYGQALEFVNRISVLAEAAGHHPDIEFGWGYVRVTLFTHAIKGLHRNDFILAAQIGAI